MQHPLIALPNKDRLMEILKGKSFGMPKAILPFREPLGNECMWQVAIYTGGRRMMAGLLPGLVLRLHDVAIQRRPRGPYSDTKDLLHSEK